MKLLATLLIVIVLIVVGAIGFAYSGIYDVSASSPHSGPVSWLLSTTSHASIERRAGAVDVPDLSDESLVLAGVNDFDAMCAGCHGAPGQVPEAVGQGLNPTAPDLAESAAHMSSAELFWVTKHGIKMTGMPAWGATHDDDALWPVVALLTTLPDLDGEAYQELLASAQGMGHHAGDDDNGPHDHGENAPVSSAHEHDHAGSSTEHEGPANDDHNHDAPMADQAEPPHHDGHDHEH